MIWSLLKVLMFVAAIAGLTFGASALLDTGGGIRIAAAGYEFSFGPLQAVIGALILVLALWLLMKTIGFVVATLRFLNGDETALSRYFDRNRERKGYQALADGLMALAAGEGRLALLRAQRAEKYLDRPELTTLLVAQASEAAGDTARATEAYKRLLGEEASRFVGVRGLLKQKLSEGDTATALKLAEKAFVLKPKHGEIQDILLKLQSESADWKGARTTLGAQMKAGALPKDLYRRRDAVLALQEAKGIMDETASADAIEAAIEANRKSPDLIPAAVLACRNLVAKGDKKTATRIIRKAWQGAPHPDLAAAFAEIEPDESPSARLKRFKPLIAEHSGHDETLLMQAEMLIAAEDFPAARRVLGDIVTRHPTQRALAIMAAIERGEGADEATVRAWLARALTAPRGAQWCCDKCQAIHAEWQPICSNCAGFDTLSWREPTENTTKSAHGAELLPLLVSPPVAAVPTVSATDEVPEIIDLAAVARNAN